MIILAILLLLLASCQTQDTVSAADLGFEAVCKDAIFADPAPLISVSTNNSQLVWQQSQLKVASYMPRSTYQKFWTGISKTSSNRYTWVSLVPEVEIFCRNYLLSQPTLQSSSDCKPSITKRINQYLGLTPNEDPDKVLVTFYVESKNLIRACYNPDIQSDSCVRFPLNNTAANTIDMQDFISSKYEGNVTGNCYPFTGMGYTFDWGEPTTENVGANEFIISGDTDIFNVQVQEIDQLCGCKNSST